MRLALVILSAAAIAVGMVHLRRCEIAARHRIQQLSSRQVELRRALWDQQLRLGRLTWPGQVRRRAEEMSLGLSELSGVTHGLAGASSVRD